MPELDREELATREARETYLPTDDDIDMAGGLAELLRSRGQVRQALFVEVMKGRFQEL